MSEQPATVREERALSIARAALSACDARQVTRDAGVVWQPAEPPSGMFAVPVLNRVYDVSYPGGFVRLRGSEQKVKHAAGLLVLHYLVHADGHPCAGRWVSFRDLSDGLIYESAFRGRVEPPLLGAFGDRPERLQAAAKTLGARPICFGDVGLAFQVLPRLSMAVVLYLGDDELPPSIRVLYDGAAGHYLPTEDLAIQGGLLVGALFGATR